MSKIVDIQTQIFKLPMAGALSWGQASRMDEVEHVLVRLVTDSGHVGWAEAPPRPTIYGETPQSIKTIIEQHLAPRLIGQKLDDLAALNRSMGVIANNHTAKGATDICLYEAIAAEQGLSLLAYINPANRKVKVSYILGIAERETMLAEARQMYDRGVRVFKVKVGRNFVDDLTRIRELQSEFSGSDVALYADANEGLAPAEAATQLQQLAELGLLYIEEPLPVELIEARAKLRAAAILPLIGDDSCFTPRDLRRELNFDTFDILNIKPARTGYTHSFQMLAAARHRGKTVMVGSQASSTMGTIRAAIFAGLDGVTHPCELSFFLKLKEDIVNRPLVLDDGYLLLNQLENIVIDEARLAAAAV